MLTSLAISLYAFFDFNFSMLPEYITGSVEYIYSGDSVVGEVFNVSFPIIPESVIRVCRIILLLIIGYSLLNYAKKRRYDP